VSNQRLEVNDDVSSCSNAPRSARKSFSGRQIRSSRTASTTTTTTTTMTTILTFVKSGSFSGCDMQQEDSERTANSDPQSNPTKMHCCSALMSSSESETHEEEPPTCGRPACVEYACNNYNNNALIIKQMLVTPYNAGDSDIEKNSLGNNSSEQAWDNYQVKIKDGNAYFIF
jgi:hypothetical protein